MTTCYSVSVFNLRCLKPCNLMLDWCYQYHFPNCLHTLKVLHPCNISVTVFMLVALTAYTCYSYMLSCRRMCIHTLLGAISCWHKWHILLIYTHLAYCWHMLQGQCHFTTGFTPTNGLVDLVSKRLNLF